jgi:glycosyltransferase involved in cell wall biosynthesis
MKILLAHNYYRQPGGEDAVFAAEADLLRQQGHKVIEFVEDNHRIEAMGPLPAAMQTVWSRPARRKFIHILRQNRAEVVHFHNTFLLISPSAYYACKELDVPVVQTLHNYRLLCPGATLLRDGRICEDCLGNTPPWPGFVHGCYRNSRPQSAVVGAMLTVHRWLKTWQQQVDVFVALTEFARRKFVQGGLPAGKMVFKPNFILPDPGMREGIGSYALFIGRLSPEKGVRTLLKAWQHLKNIPLRIVGDGPLMDEVQKELRARQLDSVEILGQLDFREVLQLIKGARFLVFPSQWYEGFPMSIVEAFACGLPVIASRLGAMREIIAEKDTGLHFKPDDPEDLAEQVDWAWRHAEQMCQMGRKARREYQLKYTPEKNYEMLMQIYQKAMAQKGA